MSKALDDLVSEFRSGHLTRRGPLAKASALGVSAAALGALVDQEPAYAGDVSPARVLHGSLASGRWEIVDLSVTTAENHPTNRPTDPLFHIVPMTWFKEIPGPNGSNGAVEASMAAVQRYEIT